MHLKVFVKLKKNPKNPLVWAKKPKKNPKNPKNPKKPKKPTGLDFFKKNPGFFQPCYNAPLCIPSLPRVTNLVFVCIPASPRMTTLMPTTVSLHALPRMTTLVSCMGALVVQLQTSSILG
jgi:hypothetical protein